MNDQLNIHLFINECCWQTGISSNTSLPFSQTLVTRSGSHRALSIRFGLMINESIHVIYFQGSFVSGLIGINHIHTRVQNTSSPRQLTLDFVYIIS